MKKLTVLFLASAVTFLIACGGTQEKTTEPVVKKDFDTGLWVKTSNKQLDKIPVEGFAYKSSEVPAQKWDRWAKVAAPVVKKILDELPEGYVLEVRGHTDARGPEEPVGNKPGNIKISRDRARSVHTALRNNGITSPNLTYDGVGSAEPLSGIDPKSPDQRRVTFEVVPAR